MGYAHQANMGYAHDATLVPYAYMLWRVKEDDTGIGAAAAWKADTRWCAGRFPLHPCPSPEAPGQPE